MVTTNKKKDTEEPLDNFLTDDHTISFNEIPSHSHTWITSTSTSSGIQTLNTGSVSYTSDNVVLINDGTDWSWSTSATFNDPYSELEEIREEQEEEKKLREEYPCLQEAYENYQLIKKLLQDEECDKYFEDRMRVFKK